MEVKTLRISRKISKKESLVLDDYKKVIDVIGKNIAYTDLFEGDKSNLNLIVFYIIQASYGFIRSIFDLWVDAGYHSAYILARSLVEYFINLSFILKEDSNKRAAIFVNAYSKCKDPFKNTEFEYISARAKNAGLVHHYKKDYKSLCSFAHVNLKGSLIARDTEKFKKDKDVFLRNMLFVFTEMLEIVSKKMVVEYPKNMQLLIQEIQKKYNV